MTSGSYRYGLPNDFGGGRLNIRDKTNHSKIPLISPHQFDVLYDDPDETTSGSPLVATIKGMELWICPPPDGADVIELEYLRMGGGVYEAIITEDEELFLMEDSEGMAAETSEDTMSFAWLPEVDRFRCCDYAVSRSFASLHEWDGAFFYYKKWKEHVKKGIRADGKKKLQGSRARSVFQA